MLHKEAIGSTHYKISSLCIMKNLSLLSSTNVIYHLNIYLHLHNSLLFLCVCLETMDEEKILFKNIEWNAVLRC